MTTTAAYLDHIGIGQQARSMRDAALRKMVAAGFAKLRAAFAPRPVARAA
jgi:hypothetical protein